MPNSVTETVRPVPKIVTQIFILLSLLIATKLALVAIRHFYTPDHAVQVAYLSVLSFFAMGKFIIFAPVVPLESLNFELLFSPYELATMVVYMDTAVAFLIVYNFHMLKKVYFIGKKLERVQEDSYYLLKSSTWMYDFAILGIVLFVSFPIAGTGAVGAAFLASILGFSRLVSIFWIFIGSIIGCFGLAVGAVYFESKLKTFLESPVFFFSSIGLFVILIIFTGWKMKRMIAQQRKLDIDEKIVS
ncbi:small multi-drug export protein [Candidatus Uabimicrobium sp. HlEnr_7]|uniref:small multi-drug export protein n=1 Tax=Candidatus Uabimicrobium helgolandensis TaxID=3095367 RepID=UPI003558E52E